MCYIQPYDYEPDPMEVTDGEAYDPTVECYCCGAVITEGTDGTLIQAECERCLNGEVEDAGD